MKRSKIFSFVKLSERSMVASVRIARWLSEKLQVPATDDASIADKELDTLIIVNGAYGFSKVLEPLGQAIEEARRVVWVQNDYTIIPPRDEGDAQSPFRRAFVLRASAKKTPTIFWSTCEKWFSRPGSHHVNWNMLTFDPEYDEKRIRKRREKINPTLLYYGSWREGSGKSNRVPLFERYFKDPKVPTVISSPVDKFANAFPKCIRERPFGVEGNFYNQIGVYGMGLYIEDRKSSEEFHSPANRFYEMLSAGLPMVFMPESGSMLRRAGFDPTPYQAKNQTEIKRLMERREEIGDEQRRKWVPYPGHFRERLCDQLDSAVRALR